MPGNLGRPARACTYTAAWPSEYAEMTGFDLRRAVADAGQQKGWGCNLKPLSRIVASLFNSGNRVRSRQLSTGFGL